MKKTEFKEKIDKIREYLDYVERHYDNVQKAFHFVVDNSKGEPWYSDPVFIEILQNNCKNHDLSKLSKEEFIQYREFFYPTELEKIDKEKLKEEFKLGWENHKKQNPHHWQNWGSNYEEFSYDGLLYVIENIIDWVAMSYEFGDTALDFYNNNKHTIEIPEWGRVIIERVLNKIYK